MLEFTAPKELIVDNIKVTEKVTDKGKKVTEVTEKVIDKGKKVTEVIEKVTDKGKKVTDNLPTIEIKILEILKVNSKITAVDMAKELSINRKTVSLKIKSLKAKGFIERVGSDRKGYWKILK